MGDIFQERYEVLSKLSEGGFGEVFQGRQLTTGQLVAIKTLRQQYFDYSENQLARFRREVKLCATLHHPHIVGLIDFGTTPAGLLYIVFEYVPGRTLADILASEGNIPVREAVRLMAQVLDALSCAHHAGIIHRDLKPGNIMIMSTGARRNAKVLDFGIGAILPSAGDVNHDRDRLTNSFEQLGTPAYTAPEQLRGHQPVPASDLYAWGLVLLECLTGQRVVAGRSAAEIIAEQLGPQPVEVPPQIQAHRLGKLLRLVTAKNVEQRKVTTDDLLRQLEACDVSSLELPPARPQVVDEARTKTTRVGARADQGTPAPLSTPPLEGLGDTPRDDGSTAERRQITAVCCSVDIVGGTVEDIDFEDQDSLMNEQQERCRRIAARFSGHVASVLGHQVLLCYGYPAARADDARRAALSSLALIEELAAESARLEQTRGISIEVRIGIHTGLVVAQTLQRASALNLGNVLGNTPAVASRLNGLAAPGTIAVSEITRRLLGPDFTFEPLHEHLTGRGGRSMMVFRLHPPLHATAAQSSTNNPTGGAMVGRDEELALLRQRWHQSRQGMGQLIVVTGEPGIGKSRLLRELSPVVQEQPHIRLDARCTPEGQNSPLRPIIEMTALHLALHDGMPVEARRDKLEALLARYRLPLADYLPLLASLLDIPPGERFPMPQVAPQRQKSMMLDAVLSLVSAMAGEKPVLLGIEDLHWADPTTIELLSLLVEEISTTRLCVVLTARPEFSPPWRAGSMTQIHLGRLEHEAVQEMVRHIARDKAIPPDLVEKMISRTDGVPLFVEELTRNILESGALEEHESSYRLVGTLSDRDIPPTLRDSLMARLDRLGPAKATAQLAAVIGREFDFALLARISPLDEEALRAALNQIAGAEIIYRRRRLEGDLYLFKHALLREIAYESLLRGTRREHHGRIAEVLEQHWPELASTRPELLAQHHAAAQQVVKAVTYVERAAQLALSRFANAEAVAYMRQALTWLDGMKEQRERSEIELRCNMFLIQALSMLTGLGSVEVERLIERSQILVDEIGDRSSGFLVLIMLCMYNQMQAHYEVAAELGRRALEQCEADDNPLYRMDALRVLGLVTHYLGKFQEARQYMEQSIALYDSLGGTGFNSIVGFDQKVLTQTSLSFVLWAQGYPDQAFAMVRALVESSRAQNSLTNFSLAQIFLAGLHHFQGEREIVRPIAEEVIDVSRKYGGMHAEALGTLFLCWANHDVSGAEPVLAGFAAYGQELGLPYWLSMVAESEAATGQTDAALARLERCLETARSRNEVYYLSELYRLKGDVLCQRGHADDRRVAEECYQQAIAIAQAQATKLLELKATLARCRLLAESGRRDGSFEQLRGLYGWFTEGFDTPILTAAREFLASLPG